MIARPTPARRGGWLRPGLLALAGLTLSAGVQAQAPSEGVFTGTPAALLVAPDTTLGGVPMPVARMYSKPAGFLPPTPVTGPVVPGEPDFSAAALWGDGGPPPAFRVDAFSLGLDDVLATVPVAGESMVAVPPGAWGALLFSVGRDSVGAPGSLIESEALGTGGAGADLFSLVYEGSTIANPSCYPIDRPQRGLDATEMDLGGPVGGGEIGAADWFLPLFAAGDPIRPLLPTEPRVFFSVTAEDAVPSSGPSPVPSAWWDGTLPSGATILSTQWKTATATWTTPQPFLTYSQLGLDQLDDLDALAVDFDDEKLLFSVVDDGTLALDQQLQIAAWTSGGSFSGTGLSATTGTYVTSDGMGGTESVATRAGLAAGDEVDGTCTIDPGEQGSVTDLIIATPLSPLTPFKTIPASLFRDEAVGGPTITITASNIPTAPVPGGLLQVWAATSLGGGGFFLFPIPFYTEALTGADPSSTREVQLSSPGLASLAGVTVELFWVIRGTPLKQVSARLALEI